jgi:hypothetical protein
MSLTCVSTYFPVKNKHNSNYNEWFKNSLSISAPYIFFTTKEHFDFIKSFRKDLPTYFIESRIEDFVTYKYKDRMVPHPFDCPSVELNLIWNEKIFMMQKAVAINPFHSEWFHWIDAGICIYRDELPPTVEFPDMNKLSRLPKDKFIYSSSNNINNNLITPTNYYHYIAGTSYLLHASLVDRFANIYNTYLDKLIDKRNIWTDQVVLSHICKDYPFLFYKLCDGYGEVTRCLFPDASQNNFIVCAVFKNESHILSEWIQHYLIRGVDHIYLVNDHSTDNFLPILEKYNTKITLFHNDIVTKDVGRQTMIYEKYFRPILHTSKWAAILDLDEFLYSPTNTSFSTILQNHDGYSQIKVDWLHFGSNGHELQPISVVAGFTQRANFTRSESYYSHKTLFKTADLLAFSIHEHSVNGSTFHLAYSDANPPALVINHYNLQSREFYFNVKATRGDCDNWFDHNKLLRDQALFQRYDINDVEDLRLFKQNKNWYVKVKI